MIDSRPLPPTRFVKTVERNDGERSVTTLVFF